jgi:hypothetical protein
MKNPNYQQEDSQYDFLHSVAINVANIEQTVEWYKTSFSCKVCYQDKATAMIEFANVKLLLFLPSQQPPHIGLIREDAASFGEIKKQRTGELATFVSDPTGNRVKLVMPSETLEDENTA